MARAAWGEFRRAVSPGRQHCKEVVAADAIRLFLSVVRPAPCVFVQGCFQPGVQAVFSRVYS